MNKLENILQTRIDCKDECYSEKEYNGHWCQAASVNTNVSVLLKLWSLYSHRSLDSKDYFTLLLAVDFDLSFSTFHAFIHVLLLYISVMSRHLSPTFHWIADLVTTYIFIS